MPALGAPSSRFPSEQDSSQNASTSVSDAHLNVACLSYGCAVFVCANDSSGNLDVIDLGGTVVATPVAAGASPTACTWVPGAS